MEKNNFLKMSALVPDLNLHCIVRNRVEKSRIIPPVYYFSLNKDYSLQKLGKFFLEKHKCVFRIRTVRKKFQILRGNAPVFY